MQTLVSVVTYKEWKMLGIPLAAGTEAFSSSVMGKQRCRRIESTYPICVTSTEQDKPISLPVEGRSTVRRIDGGAGIGIARKRMLPCNRADKGCVALTGQHYLTGNGADFAMVFKLETICGTDEGSNANDGGASCWCSFPHARWIFHRRASWPQISIE
jgi:hypothetical protein